MADFALVGQKLGDAIDHVAAQAVKQHVQPAVQQAAQDVRQSVKEQLGPIVANAVQVALQPVHQTLAGLQRDVAGLQQDMRTLGLRQRNGMCCSGVGLGAVPIQWPHHSGGAMPALIAGQPLPVTREEVQQAEASVVDGMLLLYGLPAGPPAGGLRQRRSDLLEHAGVYL